MNDCQQKDRVPYFGFGVAAIGTGLIVQVPTLLLLVYMTDTLAIPSALAGLALFGPKLFDVITDPIMGQISDRTKSRWGRRLPYLLLGAILTGVGMSFLFGTPEYEQMSSRLIWVVVFYLIAQLGVTVFLVPYYALPAELTSDPNKRIKLMSYRAFFSFAGILVGGVIAPWLVLTAGGGNEGYRIMSLIVGAICGFVFFLSFYLLKRNYKQTDMQSSSKSFLDALKEQFAVIFKKGPFPVFMLSFLLYGCGAGTAFAVFPYYVNYILDNALSLSVLWFYLLVTAVISIPLWNLLSNKLENARLYQLAMAAMIAGSLGLFFFDSNQLNLVKLMIMIFGFGFGGTQVVAWTLLADIITWDADKQKCNRGGIFAGGMLAMEKAGFALASLVAGGVLQAMGYLESISGQQAVQTADTLLGIRICVSFIPVLLIVAAALIMFRFRLDGASQRDNLSPVIANC